MAKNLFPEGYSSEVINASELAANVPAGYRKSTQFSLDTGDFRKNGTHQILPSTGVDAWEDWCKICLMTERYTCLAYNTDFGIETEEAFHAESREKAESILTRQITEALAADPYGRTEYVSEILFDWISADSVIVTVTVEGIDNVTLDITVPLDRNRR